VTLDITRFGRGTGIAKHT